MFIIPRSSLGGGATVNTSNRTYRLAWCYIIIYRWALVYVRKTERILMDCYYNNIVIIAVVRAKKSRDLLTLLKLLWRFYVTPTPSQEMFRKSHSEDWGSYFTTHVHRIRNTDRSVTIWTRLGCFYHFTLVSTALVLTVRAFICSLFDY